jgi:flagellar basal-body rod protein FlgB
MTDSINSGNAFDIAKRALDGLSARRDMISQNIANVDTPGYKAQEVSFEGVLKQAMNDKPLMSMKTSNARHMQGGGIQGIGMVQVGNRQGGSTRADGNNVDIDQELTQMTETGIRYQAITEIVSKKLSLLKNLVR